jgi:hypothetical protein
MRVMSKQVRGAEIPVLTASLMVDSLEAYRRLA